MWGGKDGRANESCRGGRFLTGAEWRGVVAFFFVKAARWRCIVLEIGTVVSRWRGQGVICLPAVRWLIKSSDRLAAHLEAGARWRQRQRQRQSCVVEAWRAEMDARTEDCLEDAGVCVRGGLKRGRRGSLNRPIMGQSD